MSIAKTMEYFSVQCKSDGSFLVNNQGKSTWVSEVAAKNAWWVAQPWEFKKTRKGFNDQDEWMVVPVTIIPTEEYNQLVNASNWLSSLENAGVDNWDGCSYARTLHCEQYGYNDD
jgi:hypothetical protein